MQNRMTSYLKVGENKGQKRIWLESQRLLAHGFAPGEAYRTILDLDSKTLTLEVDLFGDRRVVGRKRQLKNGSVEVPIVDLCNAEITSFVGSRNRVRVDYLDNKVVISLHHEDVAMAEREARTLRNAAAGSLLTGTLCAGAGISTAALHDGLESAGLKSQCSWVVDNDCRYLEIADRNNHAINADTHLFVGTIEEMQADLLTPVDILNVSLPCDIHAACGKAKKGLGVAEEDDSITSVFGLLAIIRAVQPSIICSENVREAQTSGAYLMIRAELRRLGYSISEMVLDETHAGSLEARKRYWFVAVSKGLEYVDLSTLPLPDRPYQTVADVLDTECLPEYSDYGYLTLKAERDKAAGKGFRENNIKSSATTVGVMGKHYAKVRSTEPKLLRKDGKKRLFSVNEASRMRLIPEHLLGDCGFTIGHEAGGQSILYGHGTSIGRKIGASFRR